MNKIRKARQSKQMTQSQLSQLVDCSQVHISALESGKNFASRKTAQKISQVLGIPVLHVLFPEEKSPDD